MAVEQEQEQERRRKKIPSLSFLKSTCIVKAVLTKSSNVLKDLKVFLYSSVFTSDFGITD